MTRRWWFSGALAMGALVVSLTVLALVVQYVTYYTPPPLHALVLTGASLAFMVPMTLLSVLLVAWNWYALFACVTAVLCVLLRIAFDEWFY